MHINNDEIDVAQKLERRRAELMVAGDPNALSEILSDELYFAHSSGTVDGKASYLEQFRAGAFVYHAITPRVDRVASVGTEGLMASGLLSVHVTVNGKEKRINLIYLVVWRLESGVWRLLANQTTHAA